MVSIARPTCRRTPLAPSLWLAAFAAALLGTGSVHAQQTVVAINPTPIPIDSQFGPFETPPYGLDNVQGEMVNFETQLIKPILVTRDEQFVVVANEPDDRLVVYDPDLANVVAEVVLGQGIAALAERPPDPESPDEPAEIWVSVRHQSYVAVIDTATWTLEALLRAPIKDQGTGARRADTPGGIAFNADGTKAFVAASATDKLVVFDAVQKTWLKNIPLVLDHNGQSTAMNDPMAVLHHDGKIYVVSHLSGNQTIVDALNGGQFPGTAGPPNVTVTDLDDDPNQARSLPDFDVMVVDAATDAVVDHKTAVGTTLFGIVFHPQTGRLVVSNFESRNGEFIGEGSFPQGRVVENRITGFKPSDPPSSYIYLVTENLGPHGVNVVMPTDMAVDAAGRLFVAGYASSNVAGFAADGAFLGAMKADSGPRGLAMADGRKRLYALNRAAGTVSYYQLSSSPSLPATPAVSVALPDPTFDRVKRGREIFLDPSHSGAGTAGCFSCHHDLRKDALGWQISKFFDMDEGFTNANPPAFWKDLKGVMVTQDLRSIAEVPPYHWRGEQKDLEDFNGAFVKLLKAPTMMEPRDFDFMKSYVFSAVYPSNPFERMNRTFTDAAKDGVLAYTQANSDGTTCDNCHKLPTGTDSSITERLIGSPLPPLSTKTTQLRGLWTKSSDIANINNGSTAPILYPATGFGFFHEGSFDTVSEFIHFFFAPLTLQQKDDITQFVEKEFDSGVAPAATYSTKLDASDPANNKVGFLIDQADHGNCDLVARGRLRIGGVFQEVGLLWDSGAQVFKPDLSSLGTFTWAMLRSMAAAGDADLLFLGVPVWSGERIGVDRDRDAVYDGDEVAQGLDPVNPDSDGDGLWDSYDPEPLNPNNTILPAGAPQVVAGSVRIVHHTTNSVKIFYETDTFSPSRVEFGTTTGYGFFSGDPIPLGGDSNLWKRHHEVLLRPQPAQGLQGLEDGVEYHFRIHTQGQNGQTAATADMDTNGPIESDVFELGLDPNLRVASIDVASQRVGSTVTYTATVKVVDNHGNPLQGISLLTRLTYFVGTNLLNFKLFTTETSDSQGVITYVDSNSAQSPGDVTVFDIPMFNAIVSPLPFHWPEGPSCVEVEAP